MESRLGIDFGGVIAQSAPEDMLDPDKQAFRTAPAVAHAMETIRAMNSLLRGRVWVISKAGPATEDLTHHWLRKHQFEDETGVGRDRVIFVRERLGKVEKCRELGITHFADDQMKNLDLLKGTVEHLFLFGASSAPSPVVAAADWMELEVLLRGSLGAV